MQVIYYIQMDPFHNCILPFILTTFRNICFPTSTMIVYLIFLLLSFVVHPILAAPTAPKAKLQSTIDITQAVKPNMDNTEVEILQTFMDLSYVYTSNRRGMSSTVYPFPTLWQLKELKDIDINIPDGQSQSLSQGNFIVFNTQNDLKSSRFFDNKKIICQPKVSLTDRTYNLCRRYLI